MRFMKTDLYTKAILTVIAIMLTVIAGKQFSHPDTAVKADQPAFYSYVAPASSNYYFYDSTTGTMSIWGPDGLFKQQVKLASAPSK